MLKTLGLIGDVHAEDTFLEAALGYLSARGIGCVCCTGDIPDGPGSVDRCVQLLHLAGATTVAGNHERWLLAGRLRDLPHATRKEDLAPKTIAYLSSLPATVALQTVRGPVLLCHGLGPNDMAGVKPDDVGYALETNDELQDLLDRPRKFKMVLNGHTHRRMVRAIERLTIISAGTLSSDHQPGFGVVDFESGSVEFLDFDATGQVVPGETLSMAAAAG